MGGTAERSASDDGAPARHALLPGVSARALRRGFLTASFGGIGAAALSWVLGRLIGWDGSIILFWIGFPTAIVGYYGLQFGVQPRADREAAAGYSTLPGRMNLDLVDSSGRVVRPAGGAAADAITVVDGATAGESDRAVGSGSSVWPSQPREARTARTARNSAAQNAGGRPQPVPGATGAARFAPAGRVGRVLDAALRWVLGIAAVGFIGLSISRQPPSLSAAVSTSSSATAAVYLLLGGVVVFVTLLLVVPPMNARRAARAVRRHMIDGSIAFSTYRLIDADDALRRLGHSEINLPSQLVVGVGRRELSLWYRGDVRPRYRIPLADIVSVEPGRGAFQMAGQRMWLPALVLGVMDDDGILALPLSVGHDPMSARAAARANQVLDELRSRVAAARLATDA